MADLKLVEPTPYPEWLDVELWEDYVQYRKEIKEPLTKIGVKRSLMKLERMIDEGGDQTAIIERTIESGKWKGLFQTFKEEKPVNKTIPKGGNELVAMAATLGIHAKPGWSYDELRRRCAEKMR